jgi:hypothetical protein
MKLLDKAGIANAISQKFKSISRSYNDIANDTFIESMFEADDGQSDHSTQDAKGVILGIHKLKLDFQIERSREDEKVLPYTFLSNCAQETLESALDGFQSVLDSSTLCSMDSDLDVNLSPFNFYFTIHLWATGYCKIKDGGEYYSGQFSDKVVLDQNGNTIYLKTHQSFITRRIRVMKFESETSKNEYLSALTIMG